MRLSLALKCADGATRHITVRAEVVARKACLSLSELPLGTTYVRVPVKKLVKLRNLTQIDTRYEWDVSRATALGLHLRIEPRQGLLGPAEELKLGLEVVAQDAGDFDLLLVCKLQGSPGYDTPSLALRLTSSVQGLCVSYEVVQPEAPVLRVLAPTTAPHVPPPEAFEPPPPLEFGMATPIFEQRTLVLIVRNHSAVPTKFSLKALRFPAAELPATLAAPPEAENFTLGASMVASLHAADRAAARAADEVARAAAADAAANDPNAPKSKARTRKGSSDSLSASTKQLGAGGRRGSCDSVG